MSLNSFLKQKLSLNPALDGTTTPIGGGVSTTYVTGALLNEVFFRQSAEPDGGEAREQRQKWFVANDHPTEDLLEAKIYLANGLDAWGVTNLSAGAKSTHADDTDLKVRFIGRDTNGDPIQIECNLDGTTFSPTPDTLTDLHSVEVRDQLTGQYQGGQGDILIYQGASTLLGQAPALHHSATNEFQIWLPATLNDTGTAVDTFTNPAGVSWSAPRTLETALSVANGGTLTAEAAQGVWALWTLAPGTRPRFDLQLVLGVVGEDFL